MKTGMEWSLFGLLAVVALFFAWQTWDGMQVDLSVARLEAAAAGASATNGLPGGLPNEAALVGGQWVVKALVGTLVGGTVTAFVAALIAWGRREWRKAQGQKRWKRGPNANWGQQAPPAPKPMSEAEFYRLMLAQQGLRPPGRMQRPVLEVEDETIHF